MNQFMRRAAGLSIACGLAFGPAVSGQSVEDDLQQLKRGQAEILRQLQGLRQQLAARPAQARPALPNVKGKIVDLTDHPVKGASTAKLTLVEFSDYQ
jgi:protein-disulfide isomerase